MKIRAQWLLPLFAISSLAAGAADNFGELVMTGPDSATIKYADNCSNGAHIDEADHKKFVTAMLANEKSKLAQLKAKLLTEIDSEHLDSVHFRLNDAQQTFHDRDGCGENKNSFSFFVVTIAGGNTSHTIVRDLVTIDDDDNGDTRTLSVRKILPLNIRDEE